MLLRFALWNIIFVSMESSVLVKAFRLIELLGQEQARCTLASLAERSGLPKPTAHRILNQLAALGYVERVDTGYKLSGKLARVASGADNAALLQASESFLRRLHERTGETVNLGTLKGDRVIYLRVLESIHQLRRIGEANSFDPFHCTALGRSITAYLGQDELKRLVARAVFEKRTPYTLDSEKKLYAALEKVRLQGYAIEENETDLGVVCIGAPVFYDGRPIAAVSISLPTARAQHAGLDQLIAMVKMTASEICAKLVTMPNLNS